mmetsp:Transcript_8654/g.20779  ORF Transcript_8654/g.20779 Transcript_8654/m.20779 type:complete len:437 (-) Transcript_8654:162-1472(-)
MDHLLGSDDDKTSMLSPTLRPQNGNGSAHDGHERSVFQDDDRQLKKRKIEDNTVGYVRGLLEPLIDPATKRTNPSNHQPADFSGLNDLLRLQQSQQVYQLQGSGQSRPQFQQEQTHQQRLHHQQEATDQKPQVLMSSSRGYQVYPVTASDQVNNASPLPQPRPLRPMAERPLQAITPQPQQQQELPTLLPQITGLQQSASFLPNAILPQGFQVPLSAWNPVPNSLLNPGVQQNLPHRGGAPMLNSHYGAAAMYPPGSAALLPIPMRELPPSTMGSPSKLPGKRAMTLYIPCDDESLSLYQCLVRKHIELFEADMDEVEGNAKGRNKPVVFGQVGIRCKHCSNMPTKNRGRGSKYYPAKLSGLYQAAQSMASGHLCNHCNQIPHALRNELMILREKKSSAGGGKKYWADGVRVLGVVEDEQGLRFKNNKQQQQRVSD